MPGMDALATSRKAMEQASAIAAEIQSKAGTMETARQDATNRSQKIADLESKYSGGITIDEFADLAKDVGKKEALATFGKAEAQDVKKAVAKMNKGKVKCFNGVASEVVSKEMAALGIDVDAMVKNLNALKEKRADLLSKTGGKTIDEIDAEIAAGRQIEMDIACKQNSIKERESQKIALQGEILSKKSEMDDQARIASGQSSTAMEMATKESEIGAMTDQSSRISGEIGEAKGILSSAKGQLDQINVHKQKMEENGIKINEIEKDIDIIDIIITKVLHGSGVPLYVVSTIMAVVAIRASEILNYMSDGQMMEIKFETIEEGRGRSYGIEIHVDGKLASSFSGGERTQINAAIRFAIAEKMSEMSASNAKMKTLFIDEGDMGSLDKESALQKFLESIYNLGKYFDKIVIISHIEGVPEAFNGKIISVEKVAGHSKIAG
jgi:hypothetical protein